MSSEENVDEIPVRKPGAKKASAKKSSRRVLSLEEKYKVLKAINSGKKQAEVAQRFDPPLSQSTVATIVRSKKEIISAYEAGLYKDKRKRMKQPSYPDVEKALAEWFKKVRSINVPVNGPLLAEKARYFAEQLGYENFKASNGFLDRFKERQGITGQNVCGEEKSVDSSVVDTWAERLPDICRSYEPRDRYNADETGLLWKATPTQTLHFKGQKCSGGKNSKERVTVLVACNQDGTDKLPLLVIGKYAKPRCFRGSNMDLIPVTYKSQKKAWIDSVLFEEWVRKIDRKMKAANRHILLFIDNCTAHVSVTDLTNTRLIFFPPNCTSRLQPADQGIIQNLKVYYRQTMIRRMLQYLDEDQPIKAIDLKDATFMLAKAWDNVSTDTIQNCWRKAGFPGVVVEPMQDPFDSDEESVEEGGESSLWRRVVQQYPSLADVSFSQFASLDQDVTTENQMTENDAEREALEAVQPVAHASSQGDESDSDDDDISVIEPAPMTLVQATEAVKAVRDFVITLKGSGEREREFLSSLSAMEDAFSRLQVKNMRQTKLEEFFN